MKIRVYPEGIIRALHDDRLGETVRQGRAFDHAPRHAQCIFEGRVGKDHHPIGAHHSHERGQQVKGLKAQGVWVGVGRSHSGYFDSIAGPIVTWRRPIAPGRRSHKMCRPKTCNCPPKKRRPEPSFFDRGPENPMPDQSE